MVGSTWEGAVAISCGLALLSVSIVRQTQALVMLPVPSHYQSYRCMFVLKLTSHSRQHSFRIPVSVNVLQKALDAVRTRGYVVERAW